MFGDLEVLRSPFNPIGGALPGLIMQRRSSAVGRAIFVTLRTRGAPGDVTVCRVAGPEIMVHSREDDGNPRAARRRDQGEEPLGYYLAVAGAIVATPAKRAVGMAKIVLNEDHDQGDFGGRHGLDEVEQGTPPSPACSALLRSVR